MASFFAFFSFFVGFIDERIKKQKKENVINVTRRSSEQLRRELDIDMLLGETHVRLKEQHAQDYKNQLLKDFSLCRRMYILDNTRYAWAEIKKVENTLVVVYHEQNRQNRIFSIDEWIKAFNPSPNSFFVHVSPKECSSFDILKRIKAFQELELKIRDNKIYFMNVFTNKEESISVKDFKRQYMALNEHKVNDCIRDYIQNTN